MTSAAGPGGVARRRANALRNSRVQTATMETVATVTIPRPDGASAVFDYVVGPGQSGWYRHLFDGQGHYVAVAQCDVSAVRAHLGETWPASLVVDLRCAAAALDHTSAGLLDLAEEAALDGDLDTAEVLSERAGEVQRERLLALDEVMTICDEAWDDAVARVSRAQGEDPEALPSALRTVELLWSSRQSVRQLVGPLRRG